MRPVSGHALFNLSHAFDEGLHPARRLTVAKVMKKARIAENFLDRGGAGRQREHPKVRKRVKIYDFGFAFAVHRGLAENLRSVRIGLALRTARADNPFADTTAPRYSLCLRK